MNYYTLGDLLPILAPYADGGLCANDTGGPGGTNRVTARINQAVNRLMQKLGSTGTIQCVKMCVYNGCFTCGRDIEKVIKCRIDGYYAHTFDKWYEFLEGGPGLLEKDSLSFTDLIDRGLVPTQYDMPESMRVAVISDRPEAVGAQILIRGYDETAREVFSQNADGSWYPGEYVPITGDVMYYTNNQFSQITHVVKPVTNGYVSLSAWDQDVFPIATEVTREHLVIYHPDETRPMYRRYAFKTTAYQELEDKRYQLNALVKLRYVPMSHDSDMCQISNIAALQYMMQALRFYSSTEVEKGLQFENLAEKVLLEDTDDHETVEVIPDVQISGWGMGDIHDV